MRSMLITSILGLMAIPAMADVVAQVSGNVQWNAWATATATRASGFWDATSFDGQTCNVGYWLTGSEGACTSVIGGFSGPRPGALQFLSVAGDNKSPVQFSMNPVGTTRLVTLKLKVTAFTGNVFGWYLLSSPNALNPLFTSAHLPGATASFNPTGPFGFYLTNQVGTTFKSTTNYNFAVFSQDPAAPAVGQNLVHYWVGAEDQPVTAGPYTGLTVGNTDADYNDVLVDMAITTSDNPPPTGCTLTQGGYQNNFNFKVINSAGVTLGSVTYTPAQINQIFATPVRGNGLISLADQLITAKLNIYYGATAPASVTAAITAADLLIGGLVVPPIGAGYLAPAVTSSLSSILDDFNNGRLGTPHCQ